MPRGEHFKKFHVDYKAYKAAGGNLTFKQWIKEHFKKTPEMV